MAPELQTIPGTQHIMKKAQDDVKRQLEADRRILAGTNPIGYQNPEWLKGRWAILEAMPERATWRDVAAGWRRKDQNELNILERAKKELNELGQQKSEWQPIELTVDSGAADTVAPEDALENFDVDTSEASEEGFVVADGTKIPNLGKKRGLLATNDWSIPRNIAFPIAPVHKTLL